MIFFSPKLSQFPPPPEFGEGVVTHSPNLYFIYTLLPLTTMHMKCLAFLEVF